MLSRGAKGASILARLSGLSIKSVKNANVRGIKSDIPIQWIRPEVAHCTSTYVSGDLEEAAFPERSEPFHSYAACQEYNDLDDSVKPLFSVGFLGKQAQANAFRKELVDRVRRHAYDEGSMEVRIAKMTANIRCWQAHLKEHPRDGRLITFCKETIEKRRKYLKYLRRWDYKRFEWLLEKLQLNYKPLPDHYDPVERKKSVKRLIELYCQDVKEKKMAEYKMELQKKKEKLLKEYSDNPLPPPTYVHSFDEKTS